MPRPRYVKQRNRFHCGPIAVLNALKWAGVPVTVECDLPRIFRLFGGVDYSGVTHKEMDRVLRHAGRGHFGVRIFRRPKLGKIEAHLQDGGALIVNYYWKKMTLDHIVTARHFVLMSDIGILGGYFGMVNYQKVRPTYQRVHRNTIKNHVLRYQRTDRKYKAWFLYA